MIKNITEEFFGRCDTYLKSLNCYSRHIRHADSEPSKIKCCLLTHYMHCFYKAVLQKNEKTAFICNQKGLFPEQESILVNKIKSKPFNCPETKFIGLKKTIDWAYFYRKYRFFNSRQTWPKSCSEIEHSRTWWYRCRHAKIFWMKENVIQTHLKVIECKN